MLGGKRVQGERKRVQGAEFRVQGERKRVQGAEFRVQGERKKGCRVQSSGCRVRGRGACRCTLIRFSA
jgi:hypothetical protein